MTNEASEKDKLSLTPDIKSACRLLEIISQQRNELIDESDLSRENLRPGFGHREPAGAVDFRKLPRLS